MFVWICSRRIYSLQILQSCCPTSSLIYINVKANLPFRMALQFCKLQRVSFNISKVWMFLAPNDFCCLIPLATIGHKATKTSSSTLTSSSSTARVLICQRFGPNSVTGLAQQTGHTNIYSVYWSVYGPFFLSRVLKTWVSWQFSRMNSPRAGVMNSCQKPGSQCSPVVPNRLRCGETNLLQEIPWNSPWCDYNHPPICSIYRVNALFLGCFQK